MADKDQDLQHHIWRMTLNGALYLSPIAENVENVLDVGTGTGIWAIEFAQVLIPFTSDGQSNVS